MDAIAFILIILGLVTLGYLFIVLRDWRQTRALHIDDEPQSDIPVNLVDNTNGVVVSAGHGRLVYMNERARAWFGLDGSEPNLTLMAKRVQPQDTFRDVFAAEGRVSFRIGQRYIEATSYPIPTGKERQMVVVMRELSYGATNTEERFDPVRAISMVGEISDLLTRSGHLQETLAAMLYSLGSVIRYDASEVNFWDEEQLVLHPLAHYGDPQHAAALEALGDTYALDEGYSGYLARYRQPMVVADVSVRSDVKPKIDSYPIGSFIGVPLQVGDRFIGTLELVSREKNAFDFEDLTLLQSIAGQVAVVIENARLYRDRSDRLSELSGLQKLAQAMSYLAEPILMYNQLHQSIAELMEVGVCSILLLNEAGDCLVAEPPYYGLSEDTSLQLDVSPSSAGYELWRGGGWYSNRAVVDDTLATLGWREVAEKQGLRALAFVPMSVGQNRIGAIMIANPAEGRRFSEHDLQTLTIFSAEVGLVIENARLYRQTQLRSEELQGLQAISQTISALHDFDDLVEQMNARIANLMKVEMVGLWLHDSQTDSFTLYTSPEGQASEFAGYQMGRRGSRVFETLWNGQNYQFFNQIQGLDIAQDGMMAIADQIGLRQLLLMTVKLGETRQGVLQVANKTTGRDFNRDDAEVLQTLAEQVAILLDNARLYSQTYQRAFEADALRKIAEELANASDISTVISETLAATAELIGVGYVSLGLLDTEVGKLSYQPEHIYGVTINETVQIDLVGGEAGSSVALARRPYLSNDVRNDGRLLGQYRGIADQFKLSQAMVVPLTIQNQSIGEMGVYNKRRGEFGERDLILLQAIAALVAAAFERQRLYDVADTDLRVMVDQLNTLDRMGRALAETLDAEAISGITRNEILRAMPQGGGVSLLLFAPMEDWRNASTPLLETRVGDLETLKLALTEGETLALKSGQALYVEDYAATDLTPNPPSAKAAFLLPLAPEDGQALGLLHIYSDTANPYSDEQRTFFIKLARQATLALVNAQRYRQQVVQNTALRLRSEQLNTVLRLGAMIHAEVSLARLLNELTKEAVEKLGFGKGLFRIFDGQMGSFQPIAHYGLAKSELEAAKSTHYSLIDALDVFQDRWHLYQNVYFLPGELQDEWFDVVGAAFAPSTYNDVSRLWNPKDAFVGLVESTEGHLMGWLSLDVPRNNRRPDLLLAQSLEVFTAQAAYLIENYQVIDQMRENAAELRIERDRLALLHMVASDIQRNADLSSRLQAVVNGIQSAGWQKVRLTLHDADMEYASNLIYTGYSEEEITILRASLPSAEEWRKRLADEDFLALKLGSAYYLRYDAAWVREHILRGAAPNPATVAAELWHPQDIVYLPLLGTTQNRIIGLVGLESPSDGLKPSRASLKPIELFATQAAAAIENARLYLETSMARETEHRLTAMMESVTASLDMESVMRTLADGLQQMVAFTRMHLALPDEQAQVFTLRRVEVTADGQVHLFDDAPIPFKDSAMAQVFETKTRPIYRFTTLRDAGEYPDLQRWYKQGERITLMAPMTAGGQTMGVLRLGSELVGAFGFDEYQELVGRLANLAAVSLQHSRLVNDLMASTAYNEAVVESIQQGIIVLDHAHTITTVNAFIKERYGWPDSAVGQSLYLQEPEFEVFLRHSIDTALQEGTPQHQFEIQDIDAQGNRITRNFYTYPLQQGDSVTGVVLLVEDVTERARLESSLQQRAEQLSALTRVSSQITSTLDPDQVVSVVLEALERVIPFDGVTLWMREGDQLKVLAARGYQDPGTASAEELVGLYADIESSALFREMDAQQQIINVGDTGANDPRFPYGDERVYRNWLGAPLISQGEVLGVLALEKRQPNYYDKYAEQLLLTFANQASIALRNAQLFEETVQRTNALDAQTQRLELLNRVAVVLAQSLDIETIFETTLRETALALGISEGAGLKIDYEYELARVVVEYPRGDDEPAQIFSLSNNDVYHRLRDLLKPVLIDPQDPIAPQVWDWLRRPDEVQQALFVPLVVGGTIIGVMHFDILQSDNDYRFNQERIEIAQTLASQAGIAVQNASLFEQSVIRTHELETLFEAAQATSVTLDLDEAMRRVVNQMLGALRADYCSIGLWDDIENRLEIRQSISPWGDQDHLEPAGTVYDLSVYPMRMLALQQREVISLRIDRADLHPAEREIMERTGSTHRLLVPLVVNDFAIGLIDLDIRESSRFFQPNDIRLARTLATQSAVAIENARLQTETRSQIEELYIINDLSTAVSSKVTLNELFPMVQEQLPVLTDADVLYVALYDSEHETLTFPIAEHITDGPLKWSTMALGKDEFSYVVRRGTSLLLAGSRVADARSNHGIETIIPNAECFLGVPMMAGEEVVGVLAVQDNSNNRAFGMSDQRILTTVASQLGVAIQNANLFTRVTDLAQELEQRVDERTAELEQERRRVQTLYDIATEASASLDTNRVLSRGLERVAEAIGASSGVILGIDELSEEVYVLHSYGLVPTSQMAITEESKPLRRKLQNDKGLAGWVLQNRQSVVIPDVQKDDRWFVRDERDQLQRSALATLLEVGEDSRGVIMLFSEQPSAFNTDHLKLVTAASSQLANSMNNAELYSLIRDQAGRLGAILREVQVESTKNTAILESVADGTMYANEKGSIILFNSAAERILGLPASRVVTRSITEFTGLYGGNSNLWMESMERWRSTEAPFSSEDFVEETLELDDGRVVNVRLSPVIMGKQFLGTVSVFRDITQMVEVDRMKSEFVSTVSHELRTPMTSIKGYADLLLLGAAGDISEAQQRFLETIKQNADRLSILVNDLLEVSRIDQNRVPMRFTPVNVNELLNNVAAHLQGRITQVRPLTVSIKLGDDLPPLRADYDRIIQIMQNLADNAYNYTPKDGVITLGAQADYAEQSITLLVGDTGVGIPDQIKDRIFERFFRGDEFDDMVLDTPGTGLGLSIVRSLVEMHRGEIWFDSERGKGTTFYVKIPMMSESLDHMDEE